MQVAFEKGTHYFWSVSKDKMLKYWDGDKVRRSFPPSFLPLLFCTIPATSLEGVAPHTVEFEH